MAKLFEKDYGDTCPFLCLFFLILILDFIHCNLHIISMVIGYKEGTEWIIRGTQITN